MLIHHLSRRTFEQRMACHHFPKHYTQRVEIRADVHADSCKLLWTGKRWCPGKAPGYRNRGLKTWFMHRLGQTQIDNFGRYGAPLLETHHDVAWFDVPVNKLLLVDRSQTGSGLRRDF